MDKSKKSVAVGLGMGSMLALPQAAEAAQEVAQLADGRPLAIVGVLSVAIGWVLFNIGGPALNQLDDMDKSKKSVAVGLGMGSMLALPQAAEAAQEVAQLADGR